GSIQAGPFNDSTWTSALRISGYPAKANPDKINHFLVVVLLTLLMVYVCLVYGPIAAFLVELFPTKIRYTSMSLPYHIGNGVFGGLVPIIGLSLIQSTGNNFAGLYYPIAIATICFFVGLFFVKETNQVDIETGSHAESAAAAATAIAAGK
ncbi:MAG TPA: MFS transporter, partial [Anaerolineae bacterium]|nr:MFS transporter [Anaerolineae bacterium]